LTVFMELTDRQDTRFITSFPGQPG